MPACSKGWGERCPRAKGRKCTCACGGANHGTAHGHKDSDTGETVTEICVRLKKGFICGDMQSRQVSINGRLLDPGASQRLVNHSPDGFCWGYGGSGPAQLALAILLTMTTEEYALAHYQAFKSDMIAKLPQDNFEIEEIAVWKWIEDNKSR